MISTFFADAAIITVFLAITTLMGVMFYYCVKGAITGKCSAGRYMETSDRWCNVILAFIPVIVIFFMLALITA